MKCNFLAHSLALQIISPELSGDSSCILTPSQSRFPRSWPTFVSQSQCQHNYRRIKCHDQDQRSFIRITAFVTRIVCDVWWSSILFMSFLCPSKMYENFYICAWPIMRAYFAGQSIKTFLTNCTYDLGDGCPAILIQQKCVLTVNKVEWRIAWKYHL